MLEDKVRIFGQIKAASADNSEHLRRSHENLESVLSKKITTAFIGAVAACEKFLGEELWGAGLPASECDQDHVYWRKIWRDLREQILNNGNVQLRAAMSELSKYTVKYNGNTRVLNNKEAEANGNY